MYRDLFIAAYSCILSLFLKTILFWYTLSVAKFDQVQRGIREIIVNNFFGGIAWAFGATLGFSVIIFLLTHIFKNIQWFPIIGDFVSNLTKYVLQNLQNSPQLVK